MRDDNRTTHHERALVGLAIIDPSAIDRTEIDLDGIDEEYSGHDERARRSD